MPAEMESYSCPVTDRTDYFYGFNLEYMKVLFPVNKFPTIGLHDTFESMLTSCNDKVMYTDDKDVIIVVGEDKSSQPSFVADDGTKYEARVFISLEVWQLRKFRECESFGTLVLSDVP